MLNIFNIYAYRQTDMQTQTQTTTDEIPYDRTSLSYIYVFIPSTGQGDAAFKHIKDKLLTVAAVAQPEKEGGKAHVVLNV